MSEGVNQTENNTKQILKVMTDSFQDMQKELSKSSDIRNILARVRTVVERRKMLRACPTRRILLVLQ